MSDTPTPRQPLAQPGVPAAAQMLADVIGRVRLLEERVVNVSSDLAEAMVVQKDTGDAATNLARQVAELRAVVTQLTAEPEEEQPPRVVDWTTLDAAAAEEQWEILYDWLDTYLVPTYELTDQVLRPCWPTHPAVRDELSALRMTWVDAYQGPHASSGRVAEWHLRHRSGAWTNIEKLFEYSKCDEGKHRDQPLPRDLRRTDYGQPCTREYWLDAGRVADLASRAVRAARAAATATP